MNEHLVKLITTRDFTLYKDKRNGIVSYQTHESKPLYKGSINLSRFEQYGLFGLIEEIQKEDLITTYIESLYSEIDDFIYSKIG